MACTWWVSGYLHCLSISLFIFFFPLWHGALSTGKKDMDRWFYLIVWAYYFDPGIFDVAEAYTAAINGATADSHENFQQSSIQDKVNAFSELLRTDRTTAVSKIQDGLQYLSYVVISTSMPAAWSLDFYQFLFSYILQLLNNYVCK